MPRLKTQGGLLLVFTVFAALVAIVNPFRELLTQDDGWAYARTVKHLLDGDGYRLDSWAAANMPAQVYFAAGMARVFGYSLSLLRISTLLLYFGGAVAFYRLLYESGWSTGLASASTVALVCSPMVIWLGFTFMTDVQFLGWAVIACWLYARGLRRGHMAILLLGGMAAALAVETRQFGIALPMGLVFSWIIIGREKRAPGRAILAGIAFPLAAFLGQLWAAKEHPTFTQSVRWVEQGLYVRQGAMSFLLQTLWRGAVLTEYLGLYLAAVVPALLLLVFGRRTRTGGYSVLAGSIAGAYLMADHLFSAMQRQGALRDAVRAALIPAIPWVIGLVTPSGVRYQLVLTVAGFVSAILLCGCLFHGPTLRRAWRERDMVSAFLLGVACAFGVLHLAYVQFNDTYLIVFAPFALIATTRVLYAREAPVRYIRAIAVCSAMLGVTFAIWMRGDYNRQEAVWQACDEIHSAGVEAIEIRGSLHWVEYHGAFDDWLAQLRSDANPGDYSGPYRLHNPFYGWVAQRQRDAQYIVYAAEETPSLAGYKVSRRVPYRDALLRARVVYVLKRKGA